MKPTNVHFVKSALKPSDYPKDRRPEAAFLGRSNVGKSSLLNALLGRKGLAKTSSTPGKTQTLNFFSVDERLYFVDLPGYGYAAVPKSLKEAWNRVMLDYLREREFLRLGVALVDARHKPSEHDCHMLEILEEAEVPTVIVATKIDKVVRGQRKQQLDLIRKTLGLDSEALIVPFSSVTGEGARELWKVIEEVLAAAPAEE